MTNSNTGPDKARDTSLLSSLAKWLQTAAPQIGMPVNLDKFSNGQSNPTYRLQTDLGAEAGRFVLRTQPAGLLLKSAHAVDREYRVMKALDKTAVPVPGMIAACDDPDVIGMKFFVMREIDGKTLFDPALAGYMNADRHALFHAKIDVLAALAQLDPIALRLEGFGKPSGYIDRQLGTWTRQYRASETEMIAAMEFLLAELPDCLDGDVPGFCVIHGDFRLDNLLIRDQVRIAALIDWELSTLGPAFIDLSYWCAMLRMDAQWPIGGLGGIDRASLGIPDEAALVAAFCAKTGLERPANWDALIAFQCFRFAAILQGVLKRHLDGNASADNAASVGGQAKLVAGLGKDILSRYIAENS
jgi:aminoglycoside phosphotransferase (APT) family kinase protein